MIPTDFEYYKPEDVEEATETYARLYEEGKSPLYYGGGTEIITMARAQSISPGAVIDIKGIDECTELGWVGEKLSIGAGVTLSTIAESGLFDLLGQAGGRVADHSVQAKITLGGNVAGTIIYREALLPLLVCDCSVVVAGPQSQREVPITDVFRERLRLGQGELIVKFLVPAENVRLPFVHVKKNRVGKIGYPLLTVVGVKKNDEMRFAFSGLCGFPFRSEKVEKALFDARDSTEGIENALLELPGPILDDLEGSDEYREFVFRNTMLKALSRLKEVA